MKSVLLLLLLLQILNGICQGQTYESITLNGSPSQGLSGNQCKFSYSLVLGGITGSAPVLQVASSNPDVQAAFDQSKTSSLGGGEYEFVLNLTTSILVNQFNSFTVSTSSASIDIPAGDITPVTCTVGGFGITEVDALSSNVKADDKGSCTFNLTVNIVLNGNTSPDKSIISITNSNITKVSIATLSSTSFSVSFISGITSFSQMILNIGSQTLTMNGSAFPLECSPQAPTETSLTFDSATAYFNPSCRFMFTLTVGNAYNFNASQLGFQGTTGEITYISRMADTSSWIGTLVLGEVGTFSTLEFLYSGSSFADLPSIQCKALPPTVSGIRFQSNNSTLTNGECTFNVTFDASREQPVSASLFTLPGFTLVMSSPQGTQYSGTVTTTADGFYQFKLYYDGDQVSSSPNFECYDPSEPHIVAISIDTATTQYSSQSACNFTGGFEVLAKDYQENPAPSSNLTITGSTIKNSMISGPDAVDSDPTLYSYTFSFTTGEGTFTSSNISIQWNGKPIAGSITTTLIPSITCQNPKSTDTPSPTEEISSSSKLFINFTLLYLLIHILFI